MTTVCLIPGDGVGQEVIPAAAQVLAAACPGLTFVDADAGWACFERHGTALPEATLQAIAASDAVLFGATQSPISGDTRPTVPGAPIYHSPILALRRQLDLYANLRPALSLLPGTGPSGSRWPGNGHVDLLIVRENTEGLYSGRERRDGDTAIAERVITRRASERIMRVACKQARLRGQQRPQGRPRPRVTIVHKANVLKVSDGLFREACLAVARDYPDIEVDEMLVDAAAMWVAKEPGRFDVLVTTNLFGDILSDLAAGLIGGLGLAPSANVGDGLIGVFEPVHGSAPDIAGRGIANPCGAILSGAMLLEHIGRPDAAAHVQRAVAETISAGITTPDLRGRATTAEVTAAVCTRL